MQTNTPSLSPGRETQVKQEKEDKSQSINERPGTPNTKWIEECTTAETQEQMEKKRTDEDDDESIDD